MSNPLFDELMAARVPADSDVHTYVNRSPLPSIRYADAKPESDPGPVRRPVDFESVLKRYAAWVLEWEGDHFIGQMPGLTADEQAYMDALAAEIDAARLSNQNRR